VATSAIKEVLSGCLRLNLARCVLALLFAFTAVAAKTAGTQQQTNSQTPTTPPQLYALEDVPNSYNGVKRNLKWMRMKPRFIWYKAVVPKTNRSAPVTLTKLACKDAPTAWRNYWETLEHVGGHEGNHGGTAQQRNSSGSGTANVSAPNPLDDNFDKGFAEDCAEVEKPVVIQKFKRDNRDAKQTEDNSDKIKQAKDWTADNDFLTPSFPSQNKNPLKLGEGVVFAIYDPDNLLCRPTDESDESCAAQRPDYIGLTVQPQVLPALVPAPLRQTPATTPAPAAKDLMLLFVKPKEPCKDCFYYLPWDGDPIQGDVSLTVSIATLKYPPGANLDARLDQNPQPTVGRNPFKKFIPPTRIPRPPSVLEQTAPLPPSPDIPAPLLASLSSVAIPVAAFAQTQSEQAPPPAGTVSLSNAVMEVADALKQPGAGDDAGSKVQQNALLSSAILPQSHNISYYNIDFGLVGTTLQNPSWTRQESAPAVNCPTGAAQPCIPSPALYATVPNPKASPVLAPVLFFTIYPRGFDAERKWRFADLLPGYVPAVTFGLSLTSPSTDFFGGLSFEVRRGVQIVGGRHIGKVNELVPPIINDPTSPATPMVIQRFHPGWFGGVTFNFNFIQQLFKAGGGN